MEISIQSDESADVSKFSQLNTTLIFFKTPIIEPSQFEKDEALRFLDQYMAVPPWPRPWTRQSLKS